jgi:hypothetical protein
LPQMAQRRASIALRPAALFLALAQAVLRSRYPNAARPTYRAIALEQRHPASVFIFVTGDPGLATHEEFAERVVFGKPLDFAALRRAVAERASDFIN